MPFRKIVLFAALAGTQIAAADISAVTSDGRAVTLRADGTWSFVTEPGAPAVDGQHLAKLTLEHKVNLARGCRLGLRLQNDLSDQIRTMVLRFTAFKEDQIAFETVSRGYSYIKPTASQYLEISFRGIDCDEIRAVEVSAARNCHVGDLTKYTATAEHCLKLIDVAPSSMLPIHKEKGE